MWLHKLATKYLLMELFWIQIEKEELAAAEKAVGKEEFHGEWTAPAAEFAQPEVADWSEGVAVPSVPIQQFPAGTVACNNLHPNSTQIKLQYVIYLFYFAINAVKLKHIVSLFQLLQPWRQVKVVG